MVGSTPLNIVARILSDGRSRGGERLLDIRI
jgi:hypothetical protein